MHGRVVDVNTSAAQFIGLQPSEIIGRPAEEVLQPWKSLLERFRETAEAQEVLQVGSGEAVRKIALRITPLYDERKTLMGRLFVFREEDPAALSAARISEPLTQPLPQPVGLAEAAPISRLGLWSKIAAFFNPPPLALPESQYEDTVWAQTIERIFVITMRALAVLVTPFWFLTFDYFWHRNTSHPARHRRHFARAVDNQPGAPGGLPLPGSALPGADVCRGAHACGRLRLFAGKFRHAPVLRCAGGMFLDGRGRVVVFLVGLLTVAAWGSAIVFGGYLPFAVAPERLRPSSPETFFASLLSFGMLSGGLTIIVHVVFVNLKNSIRKETQTRALLKRERDLLEGRVRERTAELREARDLALQGRDELRTYYQAIEQSGNSIVITDAQGNIEYVNPFFEKITGYSIQEVLGKKMSILKSGRQSPEFYRLMWNTT